MPSIRSDCPIVAPYRGFVVTSQPTGIYASSSTNCNVRKRMASHRDHLSQARVTKMFHRTVDEMLGGLVG